MRTPLCAILCSLFITSSASSAAITLDVRSDIRIVEVGDFGNASGWMRELMEIYLLQALKKPSLAGAGPDVHVVIEARSRTWRDVPQAELRDIADIDAFEIDIVPGKPAVVRISGTTVLAAGFGVMHFLEERLGITWLFPGELGVALPDETTFALPAGRERVAPEFVSRLCTGFVYRNKSIPAKRFKYEGLLHGHSLFFYGHDYFKSVKLHHLASPSHNMINIFPLSTREDHPELLPIKDGDRWIPPDKDSPKGKVGWWQAWHPCYTKAKTVEIASAKAAEAFENGQYCFSLGINDGRRVQCECDDCKQVGWPDSYYQFVSRVAERVKSHYPPHLVGAIAYGDVTYPPDELGLPENVLVMCASGGPKRHVRWSPHAKTLATYEWAHGQGYWVPNVPLAGMKANAAFYKQHGIRLFRSEIHPMWAFDGPRVYLRLKQLWDPDLDLDAGLSRYCRAAFGKGAYAMEMFYRHWAEKRDRDVLADGVTPHHFMDWPGGSWRNPTRQLAWCSKEDFDGSAECIREALSVAEDAKVKKRLDMVATFVDDSATLFEMRQLKRAMFDPDRAGKPEQDIAQALGLLDRRRSLLGRMREHPEWFLGTKSNVDENLAPSWEERGVMTIPGEVDNAVLTALIGLHAEPGQGIASTPDLPERLRSYLGPFREDPLVLHAREKHAWYKEWGYAPLQATRRGETIEFEAGRTDERIEDHATLKRRRKVHWLAGLAINVPMGAPYAYVFEAEVHGQHGELDLRVAWGTGKTRGTAVHVREAMAGEPKTIRRKVAFAPLRLNGQTREQAAEPPPETKGNLNVYINWIPDTDDSSLEGTWTIRKITFAEREDTEGTMALPTSRPASP